MKYLWMTALLIAGPALAEAPDASNLEALKRAAEQGQADAQYELGVLYEFGFKFPDHKAAAFAWYNRAAEQGNAQAATRRDALKPKLTPAERERAATLAPAAPMTPAPANVSPPADPAGGPAASPAFAPVSPAAK
jgi:hypothetical protein